MCEFIKHVCYEDVGEKVNFYQCNFNVVTVLNQISECTEFFKSKLDCTKEMTLCVYASE